MRGGPFVAVLTCAACFGAARGATSGGLAAGPVQIAVVPFRSAAGEEEGSAVGRATAAFLVDELERSGPPGTVTLLQTVKPSSVFEAARRWGASVVLVGTVVEASTSVTRRFTEQAGGPGPAVVHASASVRLELKVVNAATGRVTETIEAAERQIGSELGDVRIPGQPGWGDTLLGRTARRAVRSLVGKLCDGPRRSSL